MSTHLFALHSIELVNFRKFGFFHLDLHPEVTVVVGPNGAGKTTVAAGVAAALGSVFRGIRGLNTRVLHPEDRRVAVVPMDDGLRFEKMNPVRVAAVGQIEGADVHWVVGTGQRAPNPAKLWGQTLTDSILSEPGVILPVLASYGASRADAFGNVDEDEDEGLPSRLDGYASALTAPGSLDGICEWIRRQTFAVLQRKRPSSALSAVRAAVLATTPGASDFRFDIASNALVVEVDGRLLPVELHSAGYQGIISLVADLALRCVTLNPHLGERAAAEAEGVVVIDEIELHLHPTWQQRVVPDLRRAFPNLQFVFTTHSPQVVSSVEPACVRILQRDDSVVTPRFTNGRDANSVLQEIFGASERPVEAAEAIESIEAMIETGQLDEASQALAALRARLGPDDGTVLGLDFELHDQEISRALADQDDA